MDKASFAGAGSRNPATLSPEGGLRCKCQILNRDTSDSKSSGVASWATSGALTGTLTGFSSGGISTSGLGESVGTSLSRTVELDDDAGFFGELDFFFRVAGAGSGLGCAAWLRN